MASYSRIYNMLKVTENQDSGTCIKLRERKSQCKKTKTKHL